MHGGDNITETTRKSAGEQLAATAGHIGPPGAGAPVTLRVAARALGFDGLPLGRRREQVGACARRRRHGIAGTLRLRTCLGATTPATVRRRGLGRYAGRGRYRFAGTGLGGRGLGNRPEPFRDSARRCAAFNSPAICLPVSAIVLSVSAFQLGPQRAGLRGRVIPGPIDDGVHLGRRQPEPLVDQAIGQVLQAARLLEVVQRDRARLACLGARLDLGVHRGHVRVAQRVGQFGVAHGVHVGHRLLLALAAQLAADGRMPHRPAV